MSRIDKLKNSSLSRQISWVKERSINDCTALQMNGYKSKQATLGLIFEIVKASSVFDSCSGLTSGDSAWPGISLLQVYLLAARCDG